MRYKLMKKQLFCTIFFVLLISVCFGQKPYKVVFYNLENFFDTINDPEVKDDEFTPEGPKKWNTAKYNKKLGNIDWSILIKPIGNRCSVRKFLFGRYIQAQKQRDKQKNLFHGFSFLINIQCILRFRKPEQIRMVGHTLPQTDLLTKIRTSQHNRQISCRKNI